ncbi:MAG: electron transfer flavoprotein subunit alpha [Verrucomicrobia bacterium RIFCSPLOWO2_12_FULL_64_8]|nr:MAG: electron transfer flavoprotein subunit alpha [Verrucomicrobia bacterium RIFCSPLOWO2_12_FULL_64_8]
METILFLVHTEAGAQLGKPALEALTAARSLATGLAGSTLVVGLVGPEVQASANGIAGCGATRFFGAAGPDFAQSRYSTDALAVEAIARAAAATIIVAPATSRWNRALPGVAQRLGGRIDTHVTGLSVADGKPALTRWYYRQRMEGVLSRTTRPWTILLDPGCGAAWTRAAGSATVEAVTVAVANAHRRTTVTGFKSPPADEQTIRPDAALLFVAGAGWTKKQSDGQAHAAEAEQLILGFLRHSKASLGSTKSLVDLSGEGHAVLRFMTHLNQVGQTGSTPRHPKGLATCCHGEEPHTVGWRFIHERRAVNLNPNCSWAQGKADVLYVADAFAVMRRINELLAARTP